MPDLMHAAVLPCVRRYDEAEALFRQVVAMDQAIGDPEELSTDYSLLAGLLEAADKPVETTRPLRILAARFALQVSSARQWKLSATNSYLAM